ncbi:MAG: serine hydrolase domain-containing protein, partial [Flavobacterium sp.]
PGMIERAATGYLPNGDQTKGKRHTYPEMAAAGLWTTAEDLAKFAIDVQLSIKGESKVISKEMGERLLTPVNGGPTGLGLFIEDRDGDVYFGHGGWDEGFSSEMRAHKDKGYGVVVLTNANQPPFITEVIRAVARSYNWSNLVKAYKKQPMDTSMFSSVRGRYRNGTDGRIFITTEGDRMFFKYIRADEREELFRISDSTYVRRTDDTPIQFKTLEDGTIDLFFHERRQGVSHLKAKEDEFVPYEYVIAGNFDKALKGYQALMKANPDDDNVSEASLAWQSTRLRES